MKKATWLGIFIVFLIVLYIVKNAEAQTVCGKRADIVAELDKSYKERQLFYGVTRRKMLLEIFASRKGSFTVLQTLPGSMTCILDSGSGWQQAPVGEKVNY